MHRCIAAVVAAILVMQAVPAYSGGVKDDLVLELELRGLDRFAGEISSIAAALEAPVQSQMINMMVGGQIMSPMLDGIDSKGVAKGYLLSVASQGGEKEFRFVISMPVLDGGEAYLAGVKAMFDSAIETGNSHVFRNPVTPMAPHTEWAVAVGDDRLVMGPDKASVEMVSTGIKDQSIGCDADLPGCGTLRLRLHVPPCIPMLEEAAESMGTTFAAAASPAPSPMPVDVGQILNAEMKGLIAIMRQINTITLGFQVKEEDLTILESVEPMPGSTFATILAGVRAPSDKYMSVLPEDSMFAMVGNVSGMWDHVLDGYLELMGEIYASMDESVVGSWEASKETLAKTRGMYKGNFAIGVVPGPDGSGIGLVQVLELTKPELYEELMLSGIANMKAVEDAPFKIVAGKKREHGGVTVTPYSYEAADDIPPDMLPAMGILNAMKYELATIGSDMVMAFGGPEIMNSAITRLNSGTGRPLDKHGRFANLFPGVKARPIVVSTFDAMRTLKAVLGLVPNMDQSIMQSLKTGGPGMGSFAAVQKGSLVEVARIPISELAAIGAAVQPIAEVLPQLMMFTAAGGSTSEPVSPGQSCDANLSMLSVAKDELILEAGLDASDEVEPGQLLDYLPGRLMPVCPNGGEYVLGRADMAPMCSRHGKHR